MCVSYSKKDLTNIALFLCGENCETIASDFTLPQELIMTEESLYEICFDLKQDSTILDEAIDTISAVEEFLCILAQCGKFEVFLNYLLGKYIDNKALVLSESGFDPFRIHFYTRCDIGIQSYFFPDTYMSLFEDQHKYNAIMCALADIVYREMRDTATL